MIRIAEIIEEREDIITDLTVKKEKEYGEQLYVQIRLFRWKDEIYIKTQTTKNDHRRNFLLYLLKVDTELII